MIKKKQIIFFEPWPEVMIYKIAKEFKKNGYETISIRILKNEGISDEFFKDAFDKIISFNLSFFKINLKNTPLILLSFSERLKDIFKAIRSISKLKPYVIFARAQPNWPCALIKIIFKKIPMIYFPYDIRAMCYSSKKIAKGKGVPEFEINAEKFCFENCDGFMHKGDPKGLKYINKGMVGNNFKINPLQISFLPYCSKEFIVPINKNKLSKKDGEIHLVYIGSGGAISPESFYELNYFKEIINQKMHFHVYIKSNVLQDKYIINLYKNSWKNLLNSKYFHLHNPLDPKKIIEEISRYDYGFGNPAPKTKEGKVIMGNKIASYLEAGIPCISGIDDVFINKLMKKYNINLYIRENEIKNLKKKLRKLNYKELEKKVIKAREDFLMEKHFPRLERFVKKVIDRKNQ